MGCLNSKQAKNDKSATKKGNANNNNTATTTQSQQEKVSSPKIDIKAPPPSDKGADVDDVYAIGDELGRGAFSVVKKAKHRKTGQHVAVKIIEKKFVEKQDLMLLAREIEIMKRVNHPNVLKLFEVFETDETISLVMEIVTGGELFYKIVEKGNYSEKEAASIVKQMIQGVEYLHGEGICHRDLKPENLLCSGEEDQGYKPFRVVIADFGLSKVFNSGEALETSCGTPDYVAPEVITAEGQYDKSVDMWSCGVITYVLLCGFSPFLSSTQHGLFDKIVKCEYDFPDPEWTSISDSAKDFIRHLLVKEPKDRFTAAQCLKHPWLNGEYGSAALAGGKIQEKMQAYNEHRKMSFKK